jgi:hypothetical protein
LITWAFVDILQQYALLSVFVIEKIRQTVNSSPFGKVGFGESSLVTME